jgi:hypothetical protein
MTAAAGDALSQAACRRSLTADFSASALTNFTGGHERDCAPPSPTKAIVRLAEAWPYVVPEGNGQPLSASHSIIALLDKTMAAAPITLVISIFK